MVIGLGAWVAAPAVGQDNEPAEGGDSVDVKIIESVDDAPRHGKRAVKEALKKLDDEHRLQVTIGQFFDQGHSTSTNEFEPYVASSVPVNKEGKKDGIELTYPAPRRPGGLRSVTWVDGVKHGEEKVRDRKGNVIEVIPWVEGEIHGERKTFDAEGNVLSVAHYDKGVQTGVSKAFDSEGNLIREVPYKDGEKHGKRIDYWAQNGEPKRIVPYRNGLAHGEVVEYHLNGKVKMKVNTIKGQLHGKQVRYSDEGKVITELYWWEGSMVSRSEFEANQAAADKG